MTSVGSVESADLCSIVDADGVELRRVPSDRIDDAMAGEMIALFRATFGDWPLLDPGVTALDHLRWKTSSPFTRVGSMQAVVDGRIVLATTSWAQWLRIGGERRFRNVFTDSAVHPAYQGRRLYSRFLAGRRQILGERHDVSLHERGASPRFDRPLGREGQVRLANRVTRRYRVLRPVGFCFERRRPALLPIAIALAALGELGAATRRGALRRAGLTPRDEDRFDHRFDALFEEAASDFDVIGERTQDYLRWRYGDRRAGPFVVRSIVEGDRLAGYAILRQNGPAAYLTDLLALPGRLDVVEALISDAVAIARRADATGVELWLSRGHPYRRALRRQGFFDSGLDTAWAYHAVDAPLEAMRALADPRARVHLLMGDTDLA